MNCEADFNVVYQDPVATEKFNSFIPRLASLAADASTIQNLLVSLFSRVQLSADIKHFESYANQLVREIPSRSGQFNMMHSQIRDKSKEMENAVAQADTIEDPDDIPVIVLLGVSGAGKTRTVYDVAKERYAVYFETGTIHSTDLRTATREMMAENLKIPTPTNLMQIAESQDTFEVACEQIAARLTLARVLTLLLLHASGKVTSPSDWLLAQLSCGGEVSLIVFHQLVDLLPATSYQTALHTSLKICRGIFPQKLTVITDEAHLLLHEMAGAFRRPSHRKYSMADLYSPGKGMKAKQRRAFLSFWLTFVCSLPVLPIVCGTTLRLLDLELIKPATGQANKVPTVVKDFPYLDQKRAEFILQFHLDLTGISDEEVSLMAYELTGVFGSYFVYFILFIFCLFRASKAALRIHPKSGKREQRYCVCHSR